MAGRHGVPQDERRSHSRQASGQRRRRVQRRDAAQPWRLWLAFRGLLALIVLAACGWSVLLLTRDQGGTWPVVAVVAGVLSLVMIGLDVRARRRQRAELRRQAIPRRTTPAPPVVPAGSVVPAARTEPALSAEPAASVEPAALLEPTASLEAAPPPPPPPSPVAEEPLERPPGRHSHRA